tara:strand:- start:815 stop:1000 length:186 start_codon:yes stop_codon:yes gene_type:complete
MVLEKRLGNYMKAIIKAEKAKRMANFDIYESQYLSGKAMKQDAKRRSKRAQRMLDRFLARY